MFLYYIYDMCSHMTIGSQRRKPKTENEKSPSGIFVGLPTETESIAIGWILRRRKLSKLKTGLGLIGCQILLSPTPVASPYLQGGHAQCVDTFRLLQFTVRWSQHKTIQYLFGTSIACTALLSRR